MRVEKDAVLSDCGYYRYFLSRSWPIGEGFVNFIMLNSSTADSEKDDSTIRRCVSFAQLWGYEGILVTNLFAYRATNPKMLCAAEDPVGPANMAWLSQTAGKCSTTGLIVCAWGSGPYRTPNRALNRVERQEKAVLEFLGRMGGFRLTALDITTRGAPSHPLYLLKTLKPAEFNIEARLAGFEARMAGWPRS